MTTLIIIFAICAFGGVILYEAIKRVNTDEPKSERTRRSQRRKGYSLYAEADMNDFTPEQIEEAERVYEGWKRTAGKIRANGETRNDDAL